LIKSDPDEDLFDPSNLGQWQIVLTEFKFVKTRPLDREYRTLKSDPNYVAVVQGEKKLFPRLSYSGVTQGKAVRLYKASEKIVHPDERRHALTHECFCRVYGCPYHPAYYA
jgi:hypothetical protein